MVTRLQEPDHAVEHIAAVLEVYEQTYEAAACFVYRYNPAAIRVKIIDPTFHGRSKGERHDYAWGFPRRLPEDIFGADFCATLSRAGRECPPRCGVSGANTFLPPVQTC
jgi:hypothetical protein